MKINIIRNCWGAFLDHVADNIVPVWILLQVVFMLTLGLVYYIGYSNGLREARQEARAQ